MIVQRGPRTYDSCIHIHKRRVLQQQTHSTVPSKSSDMRCSLLRSSSAIDTRKNTCRVGHLKERTEPHI